MGVYSYSMDQFNLNHRCFQVTGYCKIINIIFVVKALVKELFSLSRLFNFSGVQLAIKIESKAVGRRHSYCF